VFDRVGWEAAANEPSERELLRARLIRVLGDFGDAAILAEAKRRFSAFLQNPGSLRTGLREPVTYLAGRTADRAAYDTLLGLARSTTNTDERMRYYSALAAARDPALAKDTLALALNDETPTNLVVSLISGVASAGEHPDLAWTFVRENFQALAARQAPFFRDNFAATLLANFSDREHAADLANFAPAHATSGGRVMAARMEEIILTDADFVARILPGVDDWVQGHAGRR
jgi:ERAP1-like protein